MFGVLYLMEPKAPLLITKEEPTGGSGDVDEEKDNKDTLKNDKGKQMLKKNDKGKQMLKF